VSFEAWKEGQVTPTHQDIQVVAPTTSIKLEPVSARLQKELIHPNKTATLYGIRFSPDGKRVLAGDLPGGVVAAWDVATGKLLTTIESGLGMRGSQGTADYFFPSPDWQTLFTWRNEFKYEWVERDGKRLLRFDFEGSGLSAWDLATGRLLRTFQHRPPRGIWWGTLSLDGTKFAAIEDLPGVWEGNPPGAAGLWDLRTGQYRALPDHLRDLPPGDFSPDSQTLAMVAAPDGRMLRLFDSATGREKGVIREKGTIFGSLQFMAQGGLLVNAWVQDGDQGTGQLQWWDPNARRKVASSKLGDESVINIGCSLDGASVAAVGQQGQKLRLLLFHAPGKPPKAVPLMDVAKGEMLSFCALAFAPDGKWIAVLTQVSRSRSSRADVDMREVPQPTVRLIDIAAGEVREKLVCPLAYAHSVRFSPDGKTLATNGSGRVLLWDLANPPLGSIGESN
jgi:WD40 repeat protein